MRLFSILVLAPLILTACNGGGGGGGGGESSAQSLESHLGVWGYCENYDGNNDNILDSSVQAYASVGDGSLGVERTNFSGINCPSGSAEYKFVENYTYTRSGNTYSSILQYASYTPLSAGDVSWNNTNSWCGLTNWVLNNPQSILGRNCGGDVVNIGDTSQESIIRNGDTLVTGDTVYSLIVGTDLSPNGQTIQNGTYIYSDGESFALYATFNSGSYTVYRFDLVSKVYNIENGSYTSSNNLANFSVSSSTPLGCNSGSASRRFATGTLALTMEFSEIDVIMYALKVNLTFNQFVTAYLGSGFSQACF